ncbi:MAG: hypothetical protein WBX01_02560 [Nitrososphaeraceae archaeon]
MRILTLVIALTLILSLAIEGIGYQISTVYVSGLKLCPPGYIADESGFCDSETRSVVPPSADKFDNNTRLEKPSLPPGSDYIFTFEQLLSRGELVYSVYESKLHEFEIEYPRGSLISEEGYDDTEFSIGAGDEVSLRIIIDELNDSIDLQELLDESIESYKTSSYFQDFNRSALRLCNPFISQEKLCEKSSFGEPTD